MRRALALTFVLAALARAEDPLREDWVRQDVDVARRVVGALVEKKLPRFLERLGSAGRGEDEEDRDIGFGARRLRLAVFGGYTTTWVTVISWEGGVGPVEVLCRPDVPNWAALRDRIRAEYADRAPEVGERGLRVRIGAMADPEGFRSARAKVLGPPLGVDPDPSLAAAYLLLWSPTNDLAYGWAQGEGGDPPPGRDAVERILAHEQAPVLLDDVLRGPNPEGRLYAAEALLRREKKGGRLSEQVRANIDWVRRSPVKIQVTRGCLLTWEPAAGPLQEMLEDAP